MNDASPHPDERTHWWLPSLSAMIWSALFLGLVLTDARIVLVGADSDTCWHRRLGEWMIQHHAVIRADDALHTHQGPYVTKEWLSEILFAAMARWCGWTGFALLAAGLIATCFWLLHRQLVAGGCDAVLALGLVLVAMHACSMHWLARALLFTHLLTLVFVWELRQYQQGRASARRLFLLLPALMVAWVNLHGGFAMGLVLIAMFAMGSAFDAWRHSASQEQSALLAALFFTCGAASLMNPNGWKLHAHILSFMRSEELSTLATEFGSPNFHTVGMQGFLLLLLLLATTLIIVRPRVSATDLLLVGGWGYLALKYARNVPVFALIATPLLARWLTELMQYRHDTWWAGLYRRVTSRVTAMNHAASDAAIVAVAACVVLVVAKPAIAGGAPWLATTLPASRYPTIVVRVLLEHPDLVHGEMFNSFYWGGYLEFALPERRPFVDSRNDFYGVEVMREFRLANETKPGWETVFVKYNVGWTILPVQHPLNQILQLRPDWQRVFSNQQALVFSRTS